MIQKRLDQPFSSVDNPSELGQRSKCRTIATPSPSAKQTVNRSTRSKGGIIGFSLNSGPVGKWLITAHECVRYCDICWDHASLSSSKSLP